MFHSMLFGWPLNPVVFQGALTYFDDPSWGRVVFMLGPKPEYIVAHDPYHRPPKLTRHEFTGAAAL